MRYNISPPATPTTKTSGSGGGGGGNSCNNNSANEVLLASLKLPVQMVNTSAIQVDVHTATASPLNLTTGLTSDLSDLSDIPYIEDADANNGYRSSATASIAAQPQPIAQSQSLSAMTKKSGFPLTKLKSQFKPAQLTLSAVPIDQGTKDVDKQQPKSASGSGGTTSKPSSSNTIETKPHSVPMMTGI